MATICINPGHGENYNGAFDPGAVYKELRECDVTLKVAFMLKDLLETAKHKVIMTRVGEDMSKNLAVDVQIANDAKCDIFVSIHNNAAPEGNGIETWCMFGSPKAVNLGSLIQQALIQATGAYDRGIKDAANRYGANKPIYVCKWTNMPAVLSELMFIDNPLNYDLLKQDIFLQKCAEGIFNGVQRYFGLPTRSVGGDIDMKNIIVYGNDVDRRAAEYLADYLKCPIVHKDNYKDIKSETVFCVGGDVNISGSIRIYGSNRYDTASAVLKYIANGGKF